MVLQKTIDSLKEKPKDDRKAVAGGIAIAVVILLFFGWAFIFIKKLQNNSIQQNLGGGAQDAFNFQSVRDAQQQLMQSYTQQNANNDELQAAHNEAVSQQVQQSAVQQSVYQGSGTDQFGSSANQ